MKPVFKYILITIGILLVTGYLAWALLTFPDPKTNEVCNRFHIVFLDQSGVKLISEKEVAEMIDNNGLNPMGKTLRHVRTEEIEELLQKSPAPVSAMSTIAAVLFHKLPYFSWCGFYYLHNNE